MDIYGLLDQLEQLANHSRKVRFSSRIMIDEDEILELIDQLRQAVPEDIRQAKRLLADRERILASAQKESERMLEKADEEAKRLVDDQTLLAEARAQADGIIADAHQTGRDTRTGADDYAGQVLRELEQLLSGQLGHVRNGLAELESDRRRSR